MPFDYFGDAEVTRDASFDIWRMLNFSIISRCYYETLINTYGVAKMKMNELTMRVLHYSCGYLRQDNTHLSSTFEAILVAILLLSIRHREKAFGVVVMEVKAACDAVEVLAKIPFGSLCLDNLDIIKEDLEHQSRGRL
ncbi:hypothetical protein Tco_1237170 [Tanacetum coccineum]